MSERNNSPDPRMQEILERTRETLFTAANGLGQLVANVPLSFKLVGLRNLIIWGRAVTNVLQQLRNIEPDFEEWYAHYEKQMEGDPLMKTFYKMRSEILKEGILETVSFVRINHFGPDSMQYFPPPPPNTIDFVISDAIGGAAYIVQTPDGGREHFFVPIPPEVGVAGIFLEETPDSHLGQAIKDGRIEKLGQFYFEYLERMVDDARTRFLNK